MAAAEGKKTRGRQKIEMKKIENEEDRLITFSKRRSGINKKACELVTLTGAELAFVVFSPAGKPFSFAHPSVESVANRFLGKEPVTNSDDTNLVVEANRQLRIEELNQQYNHLLRQLEEEKEKGKKLKEKTRETDRKGWRDTPIEELTVQEMIKMEDSFKDLKNNLVKKLKERTDFNDNGASDSSTAQPPIDPAAPVINNPPLLPSGYDNFGHAGGSN